MSTIKRTKLNQLISQWPRGTVYTQRYLTELGYDTNLMRRYQDSHWVRSIGRGAYALSRDEIDWFGGVYALQKQLDLPVHPGGRTALALAGLSHYIRWHENRIDLFAKVHSHMPSWFINYEWNTKINLYFTSFLTYNLPESYRDFKHRDFIIRISSPERAVLEMLNNVPRKTNFDEAGKISENLISLRPDIMQNLLQQCTSIKVKRLLLYFADYYELPWFSEINPEKISLGSGKRSVVKDGHLDSKYLITVPNNYNHGR